VSRTAAGRDRNPAPKSRRAKGEQTRQKILDAVLRVIAREGTRGVTHRSVATEAGVQLSLTTYYFSDLEAMIREAFIHFSESSRPGVEKLWRGIFDYLDGFAAAELRRRVVREAVCEELASRAVDYLASQIVEKPVGLAVEQVFFTHTRLSPQLRRMGEAHREQLLQPLVELCTRFNRTDPRTDAELLLNTVTSLEYQALAMPKSGLDRERLTRLLRRHLGWIMGLQRA